MKKLLLIVLGLLATVAVVLLLAGALLPRLVDTGSIKKELAARASAAAGRPVSIEGPLSFSVFPQLAVKLEDLRIGQPASGPASTGSVARASVQVALGQLLRGDLLVKGLQLDGVTFALRDEQAGLDVRLTDLELSTGALNLEQMAGSPVPITAAGLLEDAAGGLSRRFELKTEATLNLPAQQYRLGQLELSLVNPAGGEPLQLQAGQLDADLAAETLTISALELAWAGLRISGQGQASKLFSQPAFQATLESEPFSPRDLLTSLGQEIPLTSDPAALGDATISALVKGSATRIVVGDLLVQLDDSRITGVVTALNPSDPQVLFNLVVDELNLDRYLPPPPSASGGQASAMPPTDLPLAALAALHAQGELRIGKLLALNLPLENIRLELTAADGVARLHNLEARLFDGSYRGEISIDGTGLAPLVSFNERLENVNLGPLLQALQGADSLSGLVHAQLSGTARGEDSAQLIATLNGSMDLRLENGALEGVDIDHRARSALAILRGGDAGTTDSGRTEIERLAMQAVIENGVVVTDSISAQLAFLELRGLGFVNLNTMLMDLELEATVRAGTDDQPDPLFEGLAGRSMPLGISGPVSQPEVKMDAGRALQQELGRRLLDKLRGN